MTLPASLKCQMWATSCSTRRFPVGFTVASTPNRVTTTFGPSLAPSQAGGILGAYLNSLETKESLERERRTSHGRASLERRTSQPAPAGGPDQTCAALAADGINVDAQRVSVETQAVVFETLRAQERFKRRFPGSFGWWAHWFLTSESASRTLMNACRVTPSRRAS